MTPVADHYEIYYADKLWNLLPAVYRALDTDNFTSNGPLREMVNRIGAQAAILRRSIDRMWEDQSIETCDDWLIPYIGDLVATNLVANLNGRSRRLDVARTVYYRRRKGTVGVLEELAYDITGWNAKVVEFFRRMGRTRHGLDPQIGQSFNSSDPVYALQQAEGIIGPLTGTPIGGTADLRNVYGASKVGSAFDEYFHTAEFRLGQAICGWHNIPRLGVFLWRLYSFEVPPTTAVPVSGCPNWYTFDPTGRDVPIFAKQRNSEQYGSKWVSPAEQQLPGPISQVLLDSNIAADSAETADQLYPGSLQVLSAPQPETVADQVPTDDLVFRPERGRFMWSQSGSSAPPPTEFWTTYHYGFASMIGAGPYDRQLVRNAPVSPAPMVSVKGGLAVLTATPLPATGTLTIEDSLTYNGAGAVNVSGGQALMILAGDNQRPLIRLPLAGAAPGSWVIIGSKDSSLVLDGLFISGGDVVLQGSFQSVSIACCTLDPGTAASDSAVGSFATSADGRTLSPTRLWIEATVETLTIGYSVLGPVQTRNGGSIQTLCINDSTLQAIPGSASGGIPSPLPPADPTSAALLMQDGNVGLSRCTLLGQVIVHHLQASDCILHDLAFVDDTQHGCVRFCAWMQGSVLPTKYESMQIPAGSVLFTSIDFGSPAYCQLMPTADSAIISDPTQAVPGTISQGAEDGSEMGAYAREQVSIKQRGLLIKYQEYMPAGLVPVIVFVT